MDIALIIVSLIVSFLCLALIAVLLALFIKSGKKPLVDPRQEESLRAVNDKMVEVKTKLDGLDSTIRLIVSNELKEQMLQVSRQLATQAEVSSAKLERFQETINASLNKSIADLNAKVDKNLTDINGKVSESLVNGFKGTSEAMSNLQARLAKIDEAQSNLDKLSTEMVSLNNVLSSNQKRGQFGELSLSWILENTFPHGKGTYYDEQYHIAQGKDDSKTIIPDAVVFFHDPEVFLCIDSKFPFADYARLFSGDNSLTDQDKIALRSSFREAVKKHISIVGEKYIIDGKTTNQAILFLPNDGVYAYIEDEFPDLVSLARGKNVVLTSPSILQPILVTFHAVQINAQRAKNLVQINQAIDGLGKEFRKFIEEWVTIKKNVNTLNSNTDKFDKRVVRIDNKFSGIRVNELTDGGDEDQPAQIGQNSAEIEQGDESLPVSAGLEDEDGKKE